MFFRTMLMIIFFSVQSTCLAMPFTPMTFWGDNSRWTKQTGGAGPQYTTSYSDATDSAGNVFVVRKTTGDLDGNSLIGASAAFITKYDNAGTKQWTKLMEMAEAKSVATDSSGNVFVAGSAYGGLDGNALTGTSDFLVTKYNSAGTKQWTKQMGVAGTATYGESVATDSTGNVFVAGFTNGGLDGNTVTGTYDFFVTKYNSAGTKQWTKQIGVAEKWTIGKSTATDSSGNVFVAGETGGGLDGNVLTGSGDFFVTKFDSAGTKQWTKQMGVANKGTSGASVATDSLGSVFVTGSTEGEFNGDSLTGTTDFFVTKYDSAGMMQWTKQMGAASQYTFGQSVASDSNGNIFVAGYTQGGLDGNVLTGLDDFFVTKYNSSGTKQWTKQMGVAAKSTYGCSVATDTTGNVFVAGYTYGNLDGNALRGLTDLFVTKFGFGLNGP